MNWFTLNGVLVALLGVGGLEELKVANDAVKGCEVECDVFLEL